MNIDTNKMNEFITEFCKLNDENQKSIIKQIYLLQQKQKVLSENPSLLSEEYQEDKINKKIYENLSDAIEILELTKNLDSENKALFIAVMEKLNPGSFTKKEELKVIIETKNISLKEALLEQFPNINAEEIIKQATKQAKQMKAKIKAG